MPLVEAIRHELLVVPWAVWLATVLTWIVSCMHLDAFRGMSARAASRCRALLFAFGPALLIGTVQVGVRIVGIGALALACLVGVALRYGGHLRVFQDRVLGRTGSQAIDNKDLLAALWMKIRNWIFDPDAPVVGRAPNVLLFKKDGSVYGGKNLGGDQ